jgi:hypothetical protein
MKIQPTHGRVVLYHPSDFDRRVMTIESSKPLAAIIAHVVNDDVVNLCVFDSWGMPYGRQSVRLHHGDGPCDAASYCEWMPYQKGQAAKTEALEAQLKS